ncbi:MAG: L,D-transpeptidase [Flavobacterium sp.]
MKNSILIISLVISIVLCSCKEKTQKETKKLPERKQPKEVLYHLENTKEWLAANTGVGVNTQLSIVIAVNRTDKANLVKMDSILVPSDRSGDVAYYLPFPFEVPYLKDVNKIIFFSYPTQTFGAYENGILVYTGQTNMGRKNDPSPTGLFYTNWKAEKTTSTFNDEWDLLWNFNIANKLGVGWHQYELPGYPASHSCLRLQEKDACYLYTWADQWVLADAETVQVKGTPVIIFGSYDFSAPKPWLQLVANPHALDISAAEIEKQTASYLSKILSQQKVRVAFESQKK